MNALETAIAAVVDGNLDGLSIVLAANHSDLLAAAAKLPQLTVSRFALARVLKTWHGGCCTEDDVQQWASFVRRGYVAGRTAGVLDPIDIGYDATYEELIAGIIGRFDEIGDIVDGEIDDNEKEEMLRSLEA